MVYTAFLAGGRAHANALACAAALVREHGARHLMRGWVPLWTRMAPSGWLTFTLYEQCRRLLGGGYLE